MKVLFKIFFFLTLFLMGHSSLYADGSRDMYYRDVPGNRAFMVSQAPANGNVFRNQAAHYVYVKSGETIAVASSAQGIGNGHIRLIRPDGTSISTSGLSGQTAKIVAKAGYTTREAEIAGPDIGYEPYKYQVTASEEGVWRIEFVAPGSGGAPQNVKANDSWQQDNNELIAAWDVSVLNVDGSSWVKGRVYTPVLNLYLIGSTLNDEERTFYGRNYVLTKDGYIYKVDGNGSHGINFYYFVNSSGMLGPDGKPSYKSSNTYAKGSFHSPNDADSDDGVHITHKMFYTMPDVTMPPMSKGAVPDFETWLYNETQIAKIDHISVRQIEGDDLYVNKKGVFIDFETNYLQSARYEVIIETTSPEMPVTRRTIIHNGNFGRNSVVWDGLDNEGNLMPVGKYPVSVSVALLEGEIHFPYFDMEINPKGILIDRINPDGSPDEPATVYWDDRDIYLLGPEEERSYPLFYLGGHIDTENRHSWGSYRTHDKWFEERYTALINGRLDWVLPEDRRNSNYGSFSFGNEKAMDTWSYGVSPQATVEEDITVRIADLAVESLIVDVDTVELEKTFTYTVVVKNNGPSDAESARFEFDLPDGLLIQTALVSFSCSAAIETDQDFPAPNTLRSVLDLPNGCIATYTITVTTGSEVPDKTYGNVHATAGIVRPLGYTDPNATSSDTDRDRPGSAAEECQEGCNNVKTDSSVFLLEPYHERGQLSLVKTVRHIDSDGSGFHEAGEELEYTFTIRNEGPNNGVVVGDIYISDDILSNQAIVPEKQILDLGESVTMIVNYVLTELDITRKYVENSAIVFGKNPRGFDVKDVSGTDRENDLTTRIEVDTKPEFQLLKSVANPNQGTGENGQFTIDDKIIYRFEIRHQGDISVGDIVIADPLIQDEVIVADFSTIFNEEKAVAVAYYVSQEDILSGYISNTAELIGTDQKYGNILRDISGTSFGNDLPTITKVAETPRGIADKYEMYQGQIELFDVLVNDLMGSSTIDRTTIEIMSYPTAGKLRIIGDKIQYQPDATYYADGVDTYDSFTYRFKDKSRLYSNETKVDIVIKATVPIVEDDFYKVGYNYVVNLKPLQNDFVEHSVILPHTIQLIDYPQHGGIQRLDNGIFEYSPYRNYTGYDSLTYRVQDKNGNWSAEGRITIEVAGFFFPNTITPNGDDKNDTFEIIGTYIFDYVELEVIDRFGRRVFYSRDYRNDWNVPESLKDGTYYISMKGVKANAKPVIRKGTVLITRDRYRGL